ncbi:MAG: tRNA (adenosine(37)-N6)-threonylcarbamoyltransferase complex ATPase subunit type 1 TsaE [Methylococcales bacterium]|nr:MAG: tRNA (adenosine(37)-N6)-threonylcarbamoyltransferase complex ATPase subunit type 1 TsaE [Methylococcales bacterium]
MPIYLNDTEATEQFGASLYKILPAKCVVFLQGDLGAGKTTLVRGFLRASGYNGTVKSPTYNIVEEYAIAQQAVFHFDLYRLSSPEELEWIGINDYFAQQSICFIEWPDLGLGFLPEPDIIIALSQQEQGRMLVMTDNTKNEITSIL